MRLSSPLTLTLSPEGGEGVATAEAAERVFVEIMVATFLP